MSIKGGGGGVGHARFMLVVNIEIGISGDSDGGRATSGCG